MKKLPILLALAFISVLFLQSCEEVTYPRPRGYPRIDLPTHSYLKYDNPSCPFSLEYPEGMKAMNESGDSCIVDFYWPEYDFYWHMTYRHIPTSGKTRMQHEDEYRKLVMKHTIKMSHLNELVLEGENGDGILYEVFGEVGAPAQMIYGDSTHLLMTAFYFEEAINQDSLSPLIEHVKEDMRHMAGSITWK